EFRKQHDEPAVEPSFIENVSEERNISNSHAGKSGKNKSFNSDVDNHARREKIFLQSQERKNSSSDVKKYKKKHSGNPEVMNTELNSPQQGSSNDVDNHARREKIFLQSQDRKNSSSDAKEDKMKHSGNPEVMNTELNSPQQGSSKYIDKLEIETSIDTAKKEYQHIILENVSEERNISNSHAEKSGKNKSFNSDIDNHARKEKIFLHPKKEKIPHLMRRRIR
ncbi:hypothetical protein TNCT_239711, partial [Trichonephila clavata]